MGEVAPEDVVVRGGLALGFLEISSAEYLRGGKVLVYSNI